MIIPGILSALIFPAMVIEAVVSARHDTALRAQGAIEPEADVFRHMQWAYPVAFGVMIVEAWLRQVTPDAVFAAGIAIFLAAKLLKYWAISTLGTRWTFRVLVPPHSARITSGPYRVLRHPNYVAVIGELVGVAIAAHAIVTGPFAVAGFGLLIWARIRVEERALAGPRETR